VAIGIAPRIELARQAGLETGRGVLTDAAFRTSDPDVFAAGDVAEVLDPATGKRGLDSLWSVAIEQGRTAGANLAGVDEPYRRPALQRLDRRIDTLISGVGGGGREDDLVTLARGDSLAARAAGRRHAVVTDAGATACA
jgi:NADPH-dependent 2,4-dienoyl-CoA reductase/sulfur reductase-like enzyme